MSEDSTLLAGPEWDAIVEAVCREGEMDADEALERLALAA